MRSFLYLDQYKLYSFSSQLFRGLVDHVVNVSTHSKRQDDTEETTTPRARVVAQIASETSSIAEKRFLHDHAYDLFENELLSRGALLDVLPGTAIESFGEPRFVRVSGPAMVAGAARIRDMMTRFNALIDAFAYVTNASTIQQARQLVTQAMSAPTDRNLVAAAKEKLKHVSPKALGEASGSRQDEEFLKQLTILLEFGYSDQLQLHVPVGSDELQLVFSAILNRDALRENEQLLVQKYSRLTDRALVVVGVPTQGGARRPAPFKTEEGTLRAGMAQMYSHMSGLENAFAGPMQGEVFIDPIAIYTQWDVPDSQR